MALNDDDKQWFRGEIQHVKDEILAASRGEIQHAKDEMIAASRGEIQHAKDEMIAASRDMQTEVLRYIGNVAEPFNVRMRHIEANTANLDTAERLRLAAVEERLLRIGKKLLDGYNNR